MNLRAADVVLLDMNDIWRVGGLPLHPLVVHAVVVLAPLTMLALLLVQLWPTARARIGAVAPIGALVVAVLALVATGAGTSLADAVGPLPGVAEHESHGRMLIPWTFGMLVAATGQWAWFRWARPAVARTRPLAARTATAVLGVLVVAVCAGVAIVLVLAGESGSRAVWGGL